MCLGCLVDASKIYILEIDVFDLICRDNVGSLSTSPVVWLDLIGRNQKNELDLNPAKGRPSVGDSCFLLP